MALSVFCTIASGFAVSSAVTLFPADRKWTIAVPSMAGNSIRIEYTQTSGGNGGLDWGPICMRPDMVDVCQSSTVRPAWGWFLPLTSYARVRTGANVADLCSFALLPFTAR